MPEKKVLEQATQPGTKTTWDHELSECAQEILLTSNQHDDSQAFLTSALSKLMSVSHAECAVLAIPVQGRWTVLGQVGHLAQAGTPAPSPAAPGSSPAAANPLPVALLGQVLDVGSLSSSGAWCAIPLDPRARSGEILALRGSAPQPQARVRDALLALAPVLACTWTAIQMRLREQRRARRLEEILKISARWNQAHDMETLLKEIAEAATRLLAADRASIFLWDRTARTLVGRPALGVDGNELRIPEHAGIVGQVLQSGQPRRVDLAEGQDQVYRRVDKELGYQTRTLLCVPLRGRNEELFGAFETINKRQGNFTDEDQETLTDLGAQAAIALENKQEREALVQSRRLMTEQAAQGVRLIGESPAIDALRSTIRRVATTDLAILILGENGTGKEVVSQSIHYLSHRRDQPFIAVNCAALSETLLESELFGHEKGAFTDAHESRAGKFELASGGTLLLDEIGDLSMGGQAKLLRVLEEKVVVRVGGSKSIHTNARVIAATNQNLADMVRQRRFRQDLYFRLNVVTIDLPPLRERPEDIVPLAEHFLEDFSRKARRKPPKFSAMARRRLEHHRWPGNVRELRNLMERLAYLLPGDRVEPEDLAISLTHMGEVHAPAQLDLPLAEATNKYQTEYIQQVIDRSRGNMTEAARHLGLHRSNLYRKMRQLGMQTNE